MEKMIFMYQIKYLGKYFNANTPFEVRNEDVQSLISQGGTVIEKAQSHLKSEV